MQGVWDLESISIFIDKVNLHLEFSLRQEWNLIAECSGLEQHVKHVPVPYSRFLFSSFLLNTKTLIYLPVDLDAVASTEVLFKNHSLKKNQDANRLQCKTGLEQEEITLL